MASDPILRVKELRKKFGDRQVLRGIDFTLARGEVVAITGRSGAGKTTFLNIVGALDSSYEGHVLLDGQELSSLGESRLARMRAERIGFVFQSFHLMPHLSVVENVALPSFFVEFDGDPHQRALDLLREVGLEEHVHVPPQRLSAGQKQRVAIARALFAEPDLLLCDEPTGNLDSETAREIMALFRKVNETHSVSMVIVTHDPIVYENVDRVLRMDDGVLREVEGG